MSDPSKYISRSVRTAYMASVIGLTLVLMFLGILASVLIVGKSIRKDVRETTQMDVFMHSHINDADKIRLEKAILDMPFCLSADKISAEEAFEYMIGPEMGFEEAKEFLDVSPINPSIVVKVKDEFVSVDSLDALAARIENSFPDIVLEAHYSKERVAKLDNSTKKPVIIILIISAFLLFIAVAMINNTIRLAIYSNRFSIKTMTLVGASPNYIRRPFLINAFIQGLISGVLSLGLLVLMVYALTELEIIAQSNLHLIEPKLFLYIFGILIALGVMISFISTFFALRKYIRIKTDNLY